MDNSLVLIVEDEPAIAGILEGYLSRESFRTVRASDGETALQHHAQLKPDIVLLDVRIPKLDGFTVLSRLRQTSSTPVIMVTAATDDLDRLSGLRLGADDYVVKPFNPQEVVARVRDHFRSLLQVDGLTRIVEDLRTLSLAIGQKLVMQRQGLDVAEAVEAVLASTKPLLDTSGFQVETDLQSAWISADSSRIRQAVLALLENACRYAASGGWLRCETEQLPDGSVVIRVLDRGPGFPEDMQAVAVNPFWLGDPSRSRETGGTGLGLSVVQAIAIAHGGHLELANRTGGGATVAIHLQQE